MPRCAGMTHETVAHPEHAADGGSVMLPVIGSTVLAIIWGAYTALVLFEIFSTPFPH
jgi:hypothetical protein